MSIPFTLIPSLPIPLGHLAHQHASLYCHSLFNDNDEDSPKFKSLYLNRLAIYGVSQYLQQAGLATKMSRVETKDIKNDETVMQLLTDAADVVVPSYGRLECRPLEIQDDVMVVPKEVWSDRIGYIAVQFNEDLSEAVLLGFVKRVKTTQVAFSELQSLDDFFPYLARIKQQAPVQLGEWFKDKFQEQWQSIESVLQPHQYQPAIARARDSSTVNIRERGRLVFLGENGPKVSVVLSVEQTSEYGYTMAVAFCPPEGFYLPGDIQLTILDDQEQAVWDVYTRDDNEKIEMKFKGETGDRFAVRMAVGEISMTEFFDLS